jgi:hypothetical protein
VELAAADEEGLAQLLQDPLGDRGQLLLVGGVLDEDGELVAAEAGHGVAGPHTGAEPLGDWMSRRSPAAWPRLSLPSLNPSRSRNSTATEGMCRCWPPRPQDQADQPQQGQDRDAGALEGEAPLGRQEALDHVTTLIDRSGGDLTVGAEGWDRRTGPSGAAGRDRAGRERRQARPAR